MLALAFLTVILLVVQRGRWRKLLLVGHEQSRGGWNDAQLDVKDGTVLLKTAETLAEVEVFEMGAGMRIEILFGFLAKVDALKVVEVDVFDVLPHGGRSRFAGFVVGVGLAEV